MASRYISFFLSSHKKATKTFSFRIYMKFTLWWLSCVFSLQRLFHNFFVYLRFLFRRKNFFNFLSFGCCWCRSFCLEYSGKKLPLHLFTSVKFQTFFEAKTNCGIASYIVESTGFKCNSVCLRGKKVKKIAINYWIV